MFFRKVLSKIVLFLMKINLFTSKIKIFNREIFDYYLKDDRQMLIAFWHNRQFMLFETHKNKNIVILTSGHKDADYPSNILNDLGYKVIRGSSSHGGAKALAKMSKEIKNKKSVGIAVDGPRGPIYEAKEGIIFLAKKFGLPIVPVLASSQNFWQLKSWDTFIIPKFFTKIYIKYGDPFWVSSLDEIEDKTKEFSKYLYSLQKSLDDDLNKYDRS